MLSYPNLNHKYHVVPLNETHLNDLYALCSGYPEYYQHLGETLNVATLAHHLIARPPSTQAENKHYLGYFHGKHLHAALELIFAYPDDDCVLIGFLMVHHRLQGQGIGSALIQQWVQQCKDLGYKEMLLNYAQSNYQNECFWLKNGFVPTGEIDDEDGVCLVAMSKYL